MTDRKTLQLRDPSESTAPLAIKKKGRGWEISEKRLDALHDRAREMRRHPTEAHKALAERFSKADLGRYKFTRHAVIGSAIVDFGCHQLGMAIAIDEGEPTPIDTRRDKSLEAVGIRVMRIKAADILENIDDVLARITAGMRMRIADKRTNARDNKSHGPRRDAPHSRTYRTSNAQNR